MNKFNTIVESVLSEDMSNMKTKVIVAVKKTLSLLGIAYDEFESDVSQNINNLLWQMEEYSDMTIKPWEILEDSDFIKHVTDWIEKNYPKRAKKDNWRDGNWMIPFDEENIPDNIKSKYQKQSGVAYNHKEALQLMIKEDKVGRVIRELKTNGQALFSHSGFEFEISNNGSWVILTKIEDGKEVALGKARPSSDLNKLFKKVAK